MQENITKLENSDRAPNGEKCTPQYCGIIDKGFMNNEAIESIYIDSNKDVYLTFKSDSAMAKKYGENYKIASNAINCGINQVGQDADGKIWVIDANGNALVSNDLKITKDNIVDLTLNKTLKNIISVSKLSTASGDVLLFIDIDGNMIH